MARSHSGFQRLRDNRKVYYSGQVRVAQAEAEAAKASAVTECQQRLALMAKHMLEVAELQQHHGPALTLSACRLTQEQVARMDGSIVGSQITRARVEELTSAVAEAPPVPGDNFFGDLQAMLVAPYREVHDEQPDWVGAVARGRDVFKCTCFRFGTDPDVRLGEFMFAMPTAQVIVFSLLEQVETYLRCDVLDSASCNESAEEWPLQFQSDFGSFFTSGSMLEEARSDIAVEFGVEYIGGNCWAASQLGKALMRSWQISLRPLRAKLSEQMPPLPGQLGAMIWKMRSLG
jgi:hypothetical protein